MAVVQSYQQELRRLPSIKEIENLCQDLELDSKKFSVKVEVKDNYMGSHPVVLTLTREIKESV